jgi:hypothetical protein
MAKTIEKYKQIISRLFYFQTKFHPREIVLEFVQINDQEKPKNRNLIFHFTNLCVGEWVFHDEFSQYF